MDFFKTGLLEKNIKSKQICLLAGALALSFSLAHANENNVDRAVGYNNPSNAVSIKELNNYSKANSHENKNDFKSSKKYNTDISEQILQKPEDKTSMEKFKAFCYRNKYTIAIVAVSVMAMAAILYKFGPKLKEKFNEWWRGKKKEEVKTDKEGKAKKEEDSTEQEQINEASKQEPAPATNKPQANQQKDIQNNPTAKTLETLNKNENTGSNNTPATTPIKKKELDEATKQSSKEENLQPTQAHKEGVSKDSEHQTPTSDLTTPPKPKEKSVANEQQGNVEENLNNLHKKDEATPTDNPVVEEEDADNGVAPSAVTSDDNKQQEPAEKPNEKKD